ncbi:MAG: hypothetical protein ACREM6_03620 [Vulcanimicrobiaceae bacterium]
MIRSDAARRPQSIAFERSGAKAGTWVPRIAGFGAVVALAGRGAHPVTSAVLALVAFALVERRCADRGLGVWWSAAATGIGLIGATGALAGGAGGWTIAAAVCVAWLAERRTTFARAGLAASAALGAIALLAVPGGLRFPFAAAASLGLIDGGRLRDLAFAPNGSLAIVFLLLCASVARGVNRRNLPLVGVLAIVGFFDLRLLAIAAIVAAPVLSAAAARLVAAHADSVRGPLGALALGCGLLFAASAVARSAGSPTTIELTAAGLALADDGASYRLVCVPRNWCDVVVRSAPRAEPMIDGRAWRFPRANIADAAALDNVDPKWPAILRRHRIDALIAPHDFALVALLRLTGGWRERDFGGHVALFTRALP